MATRKSALALAQARAFARELEDVSSACVEELQLVTSGDRTQDRPLFEIGGKGLFVKELEEALLDRRADFAVHSIKDVPGEIVPGLVLAASPSREDPRDVLVTRSGAKLSELAPGARVGTSSLRRAACLRAARPDLVIESLRGNVDTRLRRVDEGALDAVVLALAGLRRLGLESRATETLSPEVCLPAVGQGALGIECRAHDSATIDVLRKIADADTELCIAAERALLVAVEGSCRLPVAAYAELNAANSQGTTVAFRLRGMLAQTDGTQARMGERVLSSRPTTEEAARLGDDLGRELSALLKRGESTS